MDGSKKREKVVEEKLENLATYRSDHFKQENNKSKWNQHQIPSVNHDRSPSINVDVGSPEAPSINVENAKQFQKKT